LDNTVEQLTTGLLFPGAYFRYFILHVFASLVTGEFLCLLFFPVSSTPPSPSQQDSWVQPMDASSMDDSSLGYTLTTFSFPVTSIY
jgi:hypothetical protein